MRPGLTRWVPLVALLALGLTGCDGSAQDEHDEHGPAGRLALELFELPLDPDPGPELLEPLFGPEVAAADGKDRADLLDALNQLPRNGAPRIDRIEELPGLDRTAVDLVAQVAGNGEIHLSIQLEQVPQGAFRVVWFRGPDLEWPPQPRPRGDGLTSSTPRGS